MVVHTRAFGTFRASLVAAGQGPASVAVPRRRRSSPACAPGRDAHPRRRAAAAARRSWPATARSLARGPDASSPIADVAGEIVGQVGPRARRGAPRARARAGYPPNARGRAHRARARVRDRARRAAGRRAARRRPRARAPRARGRRRRAHLDRPGASSAPPSRRSPAATAAAAAVDPRTGEILALAGVAFSALQPPGSTFKIITARRRARGEASSRPRTPSRSRPRRCSRATKLANANGECCGGTLVAVLRQLVQLRLRAARRQARAPRLVATAERFGFNAPLGIPGAAESTIPPPTRSATTSPSARPRSARARCRPRRCR